MRSYGKGIMTILDKHPEKNLIRLQLSQNIVLQSLDQNSMAGKILKRVMQLGAFNGQRHTVLPQLPKHGLRVCL